MEGELISVDTGSYEKSATSLEIPQSRKSVSEQVTSNLEISMLRVNTIDWRLGFINLSYKGAPSHYVDCGKWIGFYTDDSAIDEIYDIRRAKEHYHLYRAEKGGSVDHRESEDVYMELNSRINIFFQEISPNRTKVSMKVQYDLTRMRTISSTRSRNAITVKEAVTFQSGE